MCSFLFILWCLGPGRVSLEKAIHVGLPFFCLGEWGSTTGRAMPGKAPLAWERMVYRRSCQDESLPADGTSPQWSPSKQSRMGPPRGERVLWARPISSSVHCTCNFSGEESSHLPQHIPGRQGTDLKAPNRCGKEELADGRYQKCRKIIDDLSLSECLCSHLEEFELMFRFSIWFKAKLQRQRRKSEDTKEHRVFWNNKSGLKNYRGS